MKNDFNMDKKVLDCKPIKLQKRDYAHLNNKLPLEEWIAEFLVRNSKFKEDYRKLAEVIDELDPDKYREFRLNLLKKYSVNISFKTEYLKADTEFIDGKMVCHNEDELKNRGIPNSKKIRVSLAPAISCILQRDDEGKIKQTEIMNRAEEKKCPGRIEVRQGLHSDKDSKSVLQFLLGHPDNEGYFAAGDTLLMAFNLHQKPETILKDVKKILKTVVVKVRKETAEKWKRYLIIYDLKNNSEDAGSLFAKTLDKYLDRFPDETDDWDETKIRKTYYYARELIEKGYKKFV